MERYPVLSRDGRVVRAIVSSAEFTVVYPSTCGGGGRIFLWLDTRRAVDVTGFMHEGFLVAGGVRVEAWRLIEDIPWPLAYSIPGLDWYVEKLARELKPSLEGRTVIVNFSGGKDSCAVLAVLSMLRERIGFRLIAAYSHMSFMEPLRNIEHARRVGEKLGAEVVLLEADRDLMRRRLLEEGLPYRGARWCTFMKLKPIKKLHKSMRPVIVADGDRMAEAFKRFKRLYEMSPKKPRVLSGSRLRPVYTWTLLDIVETCRRHGLVHPDYLEGRSRVACLLCPYTSPHELDEKSLDSLEDPGLAEEAIRVSYRLRYRDQGIPWEDYREQHLWRYHPRLALELYKAKKELEKREDLETLQASQVAEWYRSLWVNPLPQAPRLTPEKTLELLAQAIGEALRELLEKVRKSQDSLRRKSA